eukprot:GHVO01070272.1.p1 GENE.GHVO01070272.1~~GHVO01070272.1.p1  ORF type:complete len:176 (+),score=30.45 GHVO01070272.1:766-1293(+)
MSECLDAEDWLQFWDNVLSRALSPKFLPAAAVAYLRAHKPSLLRRRPGKPNVDRQLIAFVRKIPERQTDIQCLVTSAFALTGTKMPSPPASPQGADSPASLLRRLVEDHAAETGRHFNERQLPALHFARPAQPIVSPKRQDRIVSPSASTSARAAGAKEAPRYRANIEVFQLKDY